MPLPYQTLKERIDSEMQALQRYRRALRREDQVYFDEIVFMVQKHMLACTQADHLLPIEIFLFTILLEQQKEISSLRRLLEENEMKI